MSDLTDLELCKRIADIVKFKYEVINDKIYADAFTVTDVFSCAHMGFIFNPLTDDGLCFQLMVKYKCSTSCTYKMWQCGIKTPSNAVLCYDKSPNRAILLSIVEAHKN